MLARQTQGRPRAKEEDLRRNQAHSKRRLCWSLKLSLLPSSSFSTFPGECLGFLAARKTFWPRFRQPIKSHSPSGSRRLLKAAQIGEQEPTLGKDHVVPPGPRRLWGLPSVKDTVNASHHARWLRPPSAAGCCHAVSFGLQET